MTIRRTRIITGLVLFTYLTTHLLNHSLGLISLDAMEAGRAWFLALWRNPLSSALLYGSLLTHFTLAIYALYQRRHLRIPFWEALQLTLGLCIPLLLAVHFVGTRMAYEWYGVEDLYAKTVLTLWRQNPINGLRQALLVLIAWTHGCIGLYYWLRLRPWFPRYAAALYAFALLMPVFALLGFVQAGREVDYLIARNPDWIEQLYDRTKALRPGQGDDLVSLRDGIIYGFWASLSAVLLARAMRHVFERRRRVRITYPDGRKVRVPRGFSVLEASRFAGIPHASVCGGRGRCSTCRVRVAGAPAALPPASAAEQKLLQRVGAPPNVRLACQLRPTGNISVTPLLPANAQASDGYAQPAYLAGQERTIAVLFADLRSFTGIAERKLPYDLVFLLNSYFEAVGASITTAGGAVDKFVGDGVMALFGVDSGPEEGCRQALAAAQAMIASVDGLSRALSEELSVPLRIGIGVHCGPAVVGRMGYGESIHVTAIGDTVNVASRLQDATKEFQCQLVFSEEVAKQSGVKITGLPRHELTVRNRQGALTIFAIEDVAALESQTKSTTIGNG
ncbi:MAG TPA: adenylate/guanylate cyclase domain-containing protein [Candidatus Binatia bacterium]|nr:adenylate/guanylate cyclase domain-containing protein [Candidatus Binatia bacterium]